MVSLAPPNEGQSKLGRGGFSNKILITLSLLNGEKYYKVTTVPIKTLNETEQILTVIHKKGFNNAKLFIERKKR